MTKKLVSLLLAVLMLSGLLAACSNQPENPSDTTPSAVVTTPAPSGDETTEPLPENIKDVVGEHNFGNATFTILSRTLTNYEYIGDDSTGDVVKTAVAKRNMDVEERLGVKIEVINEPGNWGERDTFISRVQTAYTSGSKVYDMISTHSAYIVNLGLNGYSFNLAELPVIDLSKKWWCPQYTDNCLIDGAIYSAVGDGGYTLYEYTMCTFFNKKLQSTYNIPDLYDIVKSGDWTYDKMLEFASLVSVDANGSGKPDTGDIFGMSMSGHNARMCQTVWDTQMTIPDENGRQAINLTGNERYIAAYDRLYETVYKNNHYCLFVDEGAAMTPEFTEDHLLFFTEKLLEASKMRDMSSEYGIIPFPKFDADQQNYISSARDAMSAISIMRNIDNPEMVGAVTEALAMYGWKDITPEYYENTLKYRYMSDATAASMLDLIRDTLRFDFAMTYTNAINLIYGLMGDQLKAGTENIAIQIRAKVKAAQTSIDKIYADYEKIK